MMNRSLAESADLKPCPFCGHHIQDRRDAIHPTGTRWRVDRGIRHYIGWEDQREHEGLVWVTGCLTHEGGCGAEVTADSLEEVLVAWNRRPEDKG